MTVSLAAMPMTETGLAEASLAAGARAAAGSSCEVKSAAVSWGM